MLSLNNNRGYTLVEVMIAVVIGTLLITAASATYVAQNRSYITQESVSEVNTQSKIAQDIIANDIKTAGFGASDDMNSDPVNSYTSALTPVDSTSGTDSLTIVGGFRLLGTLWPSGGGPGAACPAIVPIGATSISIEYSGAERPNTSSKRHLSIDGIQFLMAATVSGSAITLDRPLSQDFPLQDTDGDTFCDTGRPVYLVEDVSFCVDANESLRRIRGNGALAGCPIAASADNEAIAENIEDLQFAYAVDADNDGEIDDQLPSDGIFNENDFIDGDAGSISDPATIKAVRINVLAKAGRPDPNFNDAGAPPATIENRDHVTAADNLRRRWWRTIVKIRND